MELPEVDLTEAQTRVIARGMMTIARSEGGVDPRELELMRSLLLDTDVEQLADLPASEVKETISSPDAAQLFLRSCLLVAFADRTYSDAERALISAYAQALGVSDDDLENASQSVKEFLLEPLSRLSNVEGVAEVSKEMVV